MSNENIIVWNSCGKQWIIAEKQERKAREGETYLSDGVAYEWFGPNSTYYKYFILKEYNADKESKTKEIQIKIDKPKDVVPISVNENNTDGV